MNDLLVLVALLLVAATTTTTDAAPTSCNLPSGYTWSRPPHTNTYYTATKHSGSWFHMVFECAKIGHPRTNIAKITDQQTVEFLNKRKDLDNGEPYWIGATRIGQNRKHWVWFKYRDMGNRGVEKVSKFFWPDDVTKTEAELSEGREDCMRHDVGDNAWSTDTCSRYHRAICQLEC